MDYKQKARDIVDSWANRCVAREEIVAAIAAALKEVVEAEKKRILALAKVELYFIPDEDFKRFEKAIKIRDAIRSAQAVCARCKYHDHHVSDCDK